MRIFNLHILTKKKIFKLLDKVVDDAIKATEKVDKATTWSAINPVVHSLKELRKNTWDKDRVDQAIKWLTDNFEGEKNNVE